MDCVCIEHFGCDEADTEENELSFKAKMLFGALVLVVVVYISTVSYTVLGSDSDKPVTSQRVDPVTLRTISPVIDNVSGTPLSDSIVTLPSIRIPVRPAMRSPFQPNWASDRQAGSGK